MPVPQLQWFEEVRDGEGGAVVLQEMVAVSTAAAARNCDGGENVRGTGFAEAWWWPEEMLRWWSCCCSGGVRSSMEMVVAWCRFRRSVAGSWLLVRGGSSEGGGGLCVWFDLRR